MAVKKDKKTIWFTDLSTYSAFTAVKKGCSILISIVKGIPFVKEKVYESKGALLLCERGDVCQEKGI